MNKLALAVAASIGAAFNPTRQFLRPDYTPKTKQPNPAVQEAAAAKRARKAAKRAKDAGHE